MGKSSKPKRVRIKMDMTPTEKDAATKLHRFFWRKGMIANQKGRKSSVVVVPKKMETATRMAVALEKEHKRVYEHNRKGDLNKEGGAGIFDNMQQQKVLPQRPESRHKRPTSVGKVNLGARSTAVEEAAARNAKRRAERLAKRKQELKEAGREHQDPMSTTVGLDHPGQTRVDDDEIYAVDRATNAAKAARQKASRTAGTGIKGKDVDEQWELMHGARKRSRKAEDDPNDLSPRQLHGFGSVGKARVVELPEVVDAAGARKALHEKFAVKHRSTLKAFRNADRSGDGNISHDEFRTVLKHMNLRLDEGSFQKLVTQFDANRDGSINFKEFMSEIGESIQGGKDTQDADARSREEVRRALSTRGGRVVAENNAAVRQLRQDGLAKVWRAPEVATDAARRVVRKAQTAASSTLAALGITKKDSTKSIAMRESSLKGGPAADTGKTSDWVTRKMNGRNKKRHQKDLGPAEHIQGGSTTGKNDDHLSNAQRGPALPDLATEHPRTKYELGGQSDQLGLVLGGDDSTPLPKPGPGRKRMTKRLVQNSFARPKRAEGHLPGPPVCDDWRDAEDDGGEPVSEMRRAHRDMADAGRDPPPLHGVPTVLKCVKRDTVPVPPSTSRARNEWGRFAAQNESRLPTARAPKVATPPVEKVTPFDGPLPPPTHGRVPRPPPKRAPTSGPGASTSGRATYAGGRAKHHKHHYLDGRPPSDGHNSSDLPHAKGSRKTAAGGRLGFGRLSTVGQRLNEFEEREITESGSHNYHTHRYQDGKRQYDPAAFAGGRAPEHKHKYDDGRGFEDGHGDPRHRQATSSSNARQTYAGGRAHVPKLVSGAENVGTGRLSTAADRLNAAYEDRLNHGGGRLDEGSRSPRLDTGSTRLQTGSTRLDTGSTRLDTGRLDTGASRLSTGNSRLNTGASAASSYMVTRDEHERLSTGRPASMVDTSMRKTPLYHNFPAGSRAINAGYNGGVDASNRFHTNLARV